MRTAILFSSLRKLFIHLPLHPLYVCLGALIAGIMWQSSGGWWASAILGVIALSGSLVLAPSTTRSQFFLYATLASLFFCIGALRLQQKTAVFYDFHRLADRKKVTIVGTVIDTEPNYKQEQSTLATVVLDKVLLDKLQLKGLEGNRVLLVIKGQTPIEPGDTIACSPLWFRCPTGEGFVRYLMKEGLVGYLFLKAERILLIEHPSFSFNRWISHLRNRTITQVQDHLSPRTFTLFASVFWGKHAVNGDEMLDIRERFKPWGTLHHLARAGLHLMILIMLWNRLLALLPLPLTLRLLIIIFIILFYALISWSSISFIRAALVFLLYKSCELFNLQTHRLYLLTLACSLVLLHNPLQLFFLDFQLSFGITFILCWLALLKKIKPLQFRKP